jgi:hypothetical protein
VVEHLLGKLEALSSNPVVKKKKGGRKEEEEKEKEEEGGEGKRKKKKDIKVKGRYESKAGPDNRIGQRHVQKVI